MVGNFIKGNLTNDPNLDCFSLLLLDDTFIVKQLSMKVSSNMETIEQLILF